jgi:hypothetical protein
MKLLFILSLLSAHFFALNLKSRATPQGIDLQNHFGAPTVGSPYGPKTDNLAEYVAANPETFIPMKYAHGNKQIDDAIQFKKDGLPGYENMLVPHVIKSGEFTNMAPSASTIISPKLAGNFFKINHRT